MKKKHSLQVQNLSQKNGEDILEVLIGVVLREREATVKMDGDSLVLLVRLKAEIVDLLKDLPRSKIVDEARFRSNLETFNRMNQVNTKLYQSILKMIAGYREIFKGTDMVSGTYCKDGNMDKIPVSIRCNVTT